MPMPAYGIPVPLRHSVQNVGRVKVDHQCAVSALGRAIQCDRAVYVRIPRDGDQRSELMSITIPK